MTRPRRPHPAVHKDFLPRLILVDFMAQYWDDPIHQQNCANFRAQYKTAEQAFVQYVAEEMRTRRVVPGMRDVPDTDVFSLAPGVWNPFTWSLNIKAISSGTGVNRDAKRYAEATRGFLRAWSLDLLPDLYPYIAARIIPEPAWKSYYTRFKIGEGHWTSTLVPPTVSGEPIASLENLPEKLPIYITTEATRDWRGESRMDTAKRLRQQFDAQLSAVLDDQDMQIEAKGFVFPDTAPKQPLYLRWLYRRFAYRESCAKIATDTTEEARANNPNAPLVDEMTVRNRTAELVKRMGLTAPHRAQVRYSPIYASP